MLSTPTLSGLRGAVSNILENTHQHIYRPNFWGGTSSLRPMTAVRSRIHANPSLRVPSPSSGFRKVRHAERHHRENLQEMQERVSFFCFKTQSWIRGVRLTTETCAWIQGLVCLFNLIVPSGEANVDRLDGSVMECVNCSSFETGGCGRMERFQKSCRCVMADCCTCLFSQPRLFGTSGEFFLVAK